MKTRAGIWILAALALAAGAGCSNQEAIAETNARDGDATQASRVAKIVFLDLNKACPCTEERINVAWDALQAALKATNAAIPVERLHVDTQAEQTYPYRELKPMVTVPAIYLLDANGGLVELLQGDVDDAQVAALIER